MPPILHQRLPVAPWMAEHTLRLPGNDPDRPRRLAAARRGLRRTDGLPRRADRRARAGRPRPPARAPSPPPPNCSPPSLAHLDGDPGYAREAARRCAAPTASLIPLDGPPLLTAGRLVQEDLCLLEKPDGGPEHRLTGAILCFPSNWTLAQKLGHGLARIHLPVEPYDENIARRVQRMFDAIRPEAPVMRANLLLYDRGDLWNPRAEFDRHRPDPNAARFVRVERQTLMRLPVTRAVVFSIHTYMVEPAALTPEQRARLAEIRPGAFADG